VPVSVYVVVVVGEAIGFGIVLELNDADGFHDKVGVIS
jgi:adenosyl cobinamide kinase/adenosyl cobinamide phosphate guanylyltransferase